jgi:hypothetical protein
MKMMEDTGTRDVSRHQCTDDDLTQNSRPQITVAPVRIRDLEIKFLCIKGLRNKHRKKLGSSLGLVTCFKIRRTP